MSVRHDSRFAWVVDRLLGDLTEREAEKETGLSHSAIGDMRRGKLPGYKFVQRLADGLRLQRGGNDRAELFDAASYRDEEKPAVEALLSGLRDLGIDAPSAPCLTVPLVAAILEALRARLEP